MKTMKKKIILYGVMVLFLSLFLIFLILDISIYKVSYITSKLDENLYYKTLYEKIFDKFDTKLKDLNIEVDVAKIIDTDMIKNDIKNYIEGYYNRESYILHTVEIENKTNKMVEDFFINNNIEIEDKELIPNEVKSLVSFYEKEIKAQSVLDKMPSNHILLKDLCVPIMVISIIAIFIIYLYMLFKLQLKPLGKVFMMTSAFILIIQYLINKLVNIKSLYTTDLIEKTVNSIRDDILYKFDIVCILLFISGIIFFIFEKMFERK